MGVFDLGELAEGRSTVWAGYLRDRGRGLRSVNHPEATRYNYLLAAGQLARYLAEHGAAEGRSKKDTVRCRKRYLAGDALHALRADAKSSHWLLDLYRNVPGQARSH